MSKQQHNSPLVTPIITNRDLAHGCWSIEDRKRCVGCGYSRHCRLCTSRKQVNRCIRFCACARTCLQCMRLAESWSQSLVYVYYLLLRHILLFFVYARLEHSQPQLHWVIVILGRCVFCGAQFRSGFHLLIVVNKIVWLLLSRHLPLHVAHSMGQSQNESKL